MPDKGDIAWMMTATLLVILMTIPGLALFYGGLVRSKNMLSVLMQVLVTFSLIVVLWALYGYSLAFTEGNAYLGGPDRLFLKGIFDPAKGEFAMAATFSKGVVIPEILFAAYQATFAGITACLIVGAFAERMKFSALVLFTVLWFTFVYLPISHMVWYWAGPDFLHAAPDDSGLLWGWGALDFAGGTVVHINAGIAGLIGCLVIGPRVGFKSESMPPHSLVMTMIGASLLWIGWLLLLIFWKRPKPPAEPDAAPPSPPPGRPRRGRPSSAVETTPCRTRRSYARPTGSFRSLGRREARAAATRCT